MAETPLPRRQARSDWRALTHARLLQLKNLIDQQLTVAPWRTLAATGMLVLIWFGLYIILDFGLRQVRSVGLIGVVADEVLFVHFFLVLAVMLAFSNAILIFGSLYGKGEAAHLLAMPVGPRQVVSVKWLEGVFLSSWSFALLGVPLMFGVAANSEVQWYYYPLFVAHFVAFIVIPACIGLLAAWAVAMFAPRRPLSAAIGAGTLLLLTIIYWGAYLVQHEGAPEHWISATLEKVAAARQPLFPSTWTAKGIVAAIDERIDQSLFYLLVVVGNAFFLTWVTINVLASTWPEAYSRAQHGRLQTTIRRGWITATACRVLFFYLPRRWRDVMLKDVRAFARDAKQWSQMLIMLGLLLIYALNLKRLPIDSDQPFTQGLIAFLNLTTVSLILATFTSRFIYPLLSLESQQLWLIELLPMRRVSFLLVKFIFALTITSLSACTVTGLAVTVLGLPPMWIWLNVLVCAGICAGLSGLSIGIGARFPVLSNRNPARIASGFGGTINLVASMAFVGIQMTGVGFLTIDEFRRDYILPNQLTDRGIWILTAVMLISTLVAFGSLWMGAKHFERLEY